MNENRFMNADPEAIPRIASYNASVVKKYNTSSVYIACVFL
jgi:hypothetical protein